jgi:hypothetical protein
MEKRKNPRIFTQGLSVEISDGIGFYNGIVSDVSMAGIKMVDLPQRLDGKASWLVVVITGHDASYRMFIKPRWSVLKGTGRSIGGVIVDPSRDWAEFIHGFEPETMKKSEREKRC